MEWREFRTGGGLAGHETGSGDILVVVLHGGPGMSDYTAELAEEVAAARPDALRVVRYQQRGQKPSTGEGPLDVAQFVKDVVEVIDHYGAGSAVVAGHSWGAHLAMQVAADRADRVAALLLVDPLGGVGDGGTGTMQQIITSRISATALEKLDALAASDLPPDDASVAELRLLWPGYFAEPDEAPPMPADLTICAAVGNELWSSVAARFEAQHLATRLPTFGKPVLYLYGRSSPIDPTANAATAALFPNAMVEELGCGHFPWIEEPGSVTSAADRLFARLENLPT